MIGRRRRRFSVAVSAGLGLALALMVAHWASAQPARSGLDEVSAALGRALRQLSAGQRQAALGTLEAAVKTLRQDAPLEVRKAVVVARPHTGLGIYDEVAVVPGRLVMLYVEVANHTHRPLRDGRFQVALAVSGHFHYEDGTDLGERVLGQHRYMTHTPAGVTSFGLDLKLGEKAPAGRYDVDLEVKDTLGGKRATRKLSFVLR